MPKGYIYAELEVTDPALFETYRPLAAASIDEFGGRYAVRGGDPRMLEGSGPPPRSVLLEFDSPELVQLAAVSSRIADQAAVGNDQGTDVDRAIVCPTPPVIVPFSGRVTSTTRLSVDRPPRPTDGLAIEGV